MSSTYVSMIFNSPLLLFSPLFKRSGPVILGLIQIGKGIGRDLGCSASGTVKIPEDRCTVSVTAAVTDDSSYLPFGPKEGKTDSGTVKHNS